MAMKEASRKGLIISTFAIECEESLGECPLLSMK